MVANANVRYEFLSIPFNVQRGWLENHSKNKYLLCFWIHPSYIYCPFWKSSPFILEIQLRFHLPSFSSHLFVHSLYPFLIKTSLVLKFRPHFPLLSFSSHFLSHVLSFSKSISLYFQNSSAILFAIIFQSCHFMFAVIISFHFYDIENDHKANCWERFPQN